MSSPVQAPLTVTTVGGTPSGRPITTIKVSNGDLTISGSTATIDTSGGGGGGTGTVTSIATTAPITGGTITTTGTIGISQADGSTDGFLSSTDWNTFDAKQDTISLTTTGTSGVATLVGATLNIPNYTNSSTIGGTIANTQVAYGSATDAIQGSANMTFDGSNLSVSGYIKGGNVTIGNGTGEIETDDGNDLILKTNTGTDSGILTLKNGVNGNLVFTPNGTGLLQLDGVSGGNDGAIKLMCSEGTHSQTISAAPHASAATYSLVLPTGLPADADNKYLVSDTSGNMSFTTGGSGSVTFPLEGSDGSAAAPTYSFSTESSTGLFLGASGRMEVSVGGVRQISMFDNRFRFDGGGGTYVVDCDNAASKLSLKSGGTAGEILIPPENEDIEIKPAGSGLVKISDAFTLPGAVTGANDYVLTAQTDGTTAWAAAGGGSSGVSNVTGLNETITLGATYDMYDITRQSVWSTGSNGTGTFGALFSDFTVAWPFTSPKSGTPSSLSIYFGSGTGGGASVAIYSSETDGSPDTLMIEGAMDYSSSAVVTDSSLSGTGSLVAGDMYWCAVKRKDSASDTSFTVSPSGSRGKIAPSNTLNTSGNCISTTSITASDSFPATFTAASTIQPQNTLLPIVGVEF